MKNAGHPEGAGRTSSGLWPAILGTAAVAGLLLAMAGPAHAATAPGLGTADSFAVLGGQAVTNTGPSVINGDLGVSPGTSITGFPPGLVNGAVHANDAVAAQAQADTTTAYNNLAGQPCDDNLSGQDLGGLTLPGGAYCFDAAAQLTGALTLDAEGNPDAVFVFQIGSTLTTASNSSVLLINGAQPCNVFWQVGSSATLGTATTFVGNVIALTSISATTLTSVEGRLLARNGSVTLDSNLIDLGTCDTGGTDGDTDGGDTDGGTDGGDTDGGDTDGGTDGGDTDGGGTDGGGTDGGTDGGGTDGGTDGGGTDGGTDGGGTDGGGTDGGGTDGGTDGGGTDGGGTDGGTDGGGTDGGTDGGGTDGGDTNGDTDGRGADGGDTDGGGTGGGTDGGTTGGGGTTAGRYGQVKQVPSGGVDTGDGSTLMVTGAACSSAS